MPGVSIRPSSFVDSGGAVPVDKDLTWKNPRFHIFDYTRKDGSSAGTTTAFEVTYVDDEENEYVQEYSVGDPKRFSPSDDEMTLVPAVEGLQISKSCNFSLLMNALINSGFPENRLPEDGNVSVLAGLRTHNVGQPEPVRSGLARPVDPSARAKVLSIPVSILQLPGEKKGKTATRTAAAKTTGKKAEETDNDVVEKTVAFIKKNLDGNDSITRGDLAQAVFRDLAKDKDRDAVANLIFGASISAVLAANGLVLTGEDISEA